MAPIFKYQILTLGILMAATQIQAAPVERDDSISVSDMTSVDDKRAMSSEQDVVLYYDPSQQFHVEALARKYDDITVDHSRRRRATIYFGFPNTYRRRKPKRKFRPSPLLG